jgi:hypothetical protein
VIQQVRKHAADLERFGTLAFEMAKSGGLPTEFARLNEPQASQSRADPQSCTQPVLANKVITG